MLYLAKGQGPRGWKRLEHRGAQANRARLALASGWGPRSVKSNRESSRTIDHFGLRNQQKRGFEASTTHRTQAMWKTYISGQLHRYGDCEDQVPLGS